MILSPLLLYIGVVLALTFAEYSQDRRAQYLFKWTVFGAAIAFAISDVFVAKDRFKARKKWHAFIITPLYFGAQALFAYSVNLQL